MSRACMCVRTSHPVKKPVYSVFEKPRWTELTFLSWKWDTSPHYTTAFHRIWHICEPCIGIIFLGTLVAFKHNKTYSKTEFRSLLPVLKWIPLRISVTQSWRVFNPKSTHTHILCKSPIFCSTSVTKETKLVILLDSVLHQHPRLIHTP